MDSSAASLCRQKTCEKEINDLDKMAIHKVIGKIFDNYAKSKPGELNKTEAKEFMQDTMGL